MGRNKVLRHGSLIRPQLSEAQPKVMIVNIVHSDVISPLLIFTNSYCEIIWLRLTWGTKLPRGPWVWKPWPRYGENSQLSRHPYTSTIMHFCFQINRCSLAFEGKGWVIKNGVKLSCNGNSSVGFEPGCVFIPSANRINATGSIMYGRQFYEPVSKLDFAFIFA